MKKPEGQNERNRVVGKYVYEVSVHELNAAAIICIADRFADVWLLKVPESIGGTVAKVTVIFGWTWILIFGLLFWTRGPDLDYGRWIKKRRGQTKR